MDTTERKIDVKKSNGANRGSEDIIWIIISSLIPVYFIYQACKDHKNWTLGSGTVIFGLCLTYFITLTIYGLDNYLDQKSILRVDDLGIFTKKYGQVLWPNIYDVQTNSYPGPRMEFYKIKYWLADGETSHTIRFTSDINCKFDDIIDSLSFYTIQNNIRMTN